MGRIGEEWIGRQKFLGISRQDEKLLFMLCRIEETAEQSTTKEAGTACEQDRLGVLRQRI
jgi:hypothetical protein